MAKRLNEMVLYQRYPWAVPVVPAIDPNEGFYDVKPWDFPPPVIELISQMLKEIEEFFSSNNIPLEVAIFEIKNVFDCLQIEAFSPHREVSLIFEKYKQLSKELF